MPLLLDWRTASQSADVVRPVVEALQRGDLVVLPTEAGYLIAANGALANAEDQLTAGSATGQPQVLVRGSPDIGLEFPVHVQRLLDRLWPGPLGIIGKARFRSPNQTAVWAVLQELKFPLVGVEPNGAQGTQEAAGVADAWGEAVAVVVDAGPIAVKPVTWLAVDDHGWRIEQAGCVSEAEIVMAMAQWIVFVCTGNTCRSPMAETLFKARLAAKLGCGVEELPTQGYFVSSAGVSAYPGDAPTPEAVEVLRDMAADLSVHRSQPLALNLVAKADHLVAMTRSHLLAVLTRYPAIGGTMRLLCGQEGDLDDPIGGSREVYEACAQTILRHLDRLIQELVR